MVMPQYKLYEYGILAFSVDMYRFTYEGNGYGDDFENNPMLFKVFNQLAKAGWEPHSYYTENDNPVWIMRRMKEDDSPEVDEELSRKVANR